MNTVPITVECSPTLSSKLEAWAQTEGVTVNQFILSCIYESLNDGPYDARQMCSLTSDEHVALNHNNKRSGVA